MLPTNRAVIIANQSCYTFYNVQEGKGAQYVQVDLYPFRLSLNDEV